jgi:hypothetical protein
VPGLGGGNTRSHDHEIVWKSFHMRPYQIASRGSVKARRCKRLKRGFGGFVPHQRQIYLCPSRNFLFIKRQTCSRFEDFPHHWRRTDICWKLPFPRGRTYARQGILLNFIASGPMTTGGFPPSLQVD